MLYTGKFDITAELKERVKNDSSLVIFSGITVDELMDCKIGDVIFILDYTNHVEYNALKQQMLNGLVVGNLILTSDGRIVKNDAYDNVEKYIKEKITHGGFRLESLNFMIDSNFMNLGQEIQAYHETRKRQGAYKHNKEQDEIYEAMCDYSNNEYGRTNNMLPFSDAYKKQKRIGIELKDELNKIASEVALNLELNGRKVYMATYGCDEDTFFTIFSTNIECVKKALQEYVSNFPCKSLTEEYTMGCKRLTTPKDLYDIVTSLKCEGALDYDYGVIKINSTLKEAIAKVEKAYTVDDELAKIDLILKAVNKYNKRERIKNEHEGAEIMLVMTEICKAATTPGMGYGLSDKNRLAMLKTVQLLAKEDRANVVKTGLHKLWLVPLQIELYFNGCVSSIRKYTPENFEDAELEIK